jgi:hypothetical protein
MPPATPPAAPQGALETMVDGMTGRAAVRQGQAMRKDIQSVADEKNRSLDEVLGDDPARP